MEKVQTLCNLLDLVMQIPRSGPPHNYYRNIARTITNSTRISQLFLLMRRNLIGTELNELSYWIYASGESINEETREVPFELSIKDCPFLSVLIKNKINLCNIYHEPNLRDKFYSTCTPLKINEEMIAFSFETIDQKPFAFIFIPEVEKHLMTQNDIDLLQRIFRLISGKIEDAYAETNLLKNSLTNIAGELLSISKNQDQDVGVDVLQAFLDYCRKKMKAEKCALFLVDYLGRSLSLERISEEGGTLHYEHIPHIPSYNLEEYDEKKKKQGVTLWVLKRKKPFNARNYEELVTNSEGQHKGNWDKFIYGIKDSENNQAQSDFKCVYMTPLLAGNDAIGVLKFENRTGEAEQPYFDQAEEREINIMGEVVGNIVLSQRIERNRYDRALPDISKTMVAYFGQQKFYEKLLEECQKWLKAEFCSLFLVSPDFANLELKAIVGISDQKKDQLKGFKYENYKKVKDSMTPWILQENFTFNVRSYEDLEKRSKGHHAGQWDKTIYEDDTRNRFKSLYSIPLKIGDEDIGVLKVENKKDAPYYFTDSDERLFDMIGRLIAIGAKYDQHQYIFGIMQRNSELGFLASGIAHEFNNYLQNMVNITGTLKNRGDVHLRQIIRKLEEQIEMAAQVINNFQEIRNRINTTIMFSLNEIIHQIINTISERFKNHEINFEYSNSSDVKINMNPADLQTLIINLLRNAEEAIVLKKVKNRYIKLSVTVTTSDLLIQVADSGGGINPEITNHLFAPYFTKKETGMGMGLFWVSQIVERNNGAIKIDNLNEYGGATFSIKFNNIVK